MKRRKFGMLIWGVALLALAVLLLGKAANLWDFPLFFDGWWTLFLIVPGVIGMISDGINVGNVILTSIGVLLLLGAQDVIELSWIWFAALILAVVGVSIILHALGVRTRCARRHDASFTDASSDDQPYPEYSVLFAGIKRSNASQDLQGANINATFGAAQIDLRAAHITHDITIKCEVAFGEVEVSLPTNVRVLVTGTPVFGGHDCSFVSSADPAAPLVTMQCSAVFGAVEIK